MEKGLYELTINESLENVMPPLQEMELKLLEESLLSEGCRDPLVVWNGVIVDGHNRYRICRENEIPFSYVEMEFKDEGAAKLWIIRNQLARRNVPDFVRCELVIPLENELKAEAEKRMLSGRRRESSDPVEKLPQGSGKTRDALAEMAGVSGRTFDKAKKLISTADEETKNKLRNGDLSIHGAYTALKNPKKDEPPTQEQPTVPSEKSMPEPQQPTQKPDKLRHVTEPVEPLIEKEPQPPRKLFPGYGLVSPVKPYPYVPPSDDVYDIPPIEVFGNFQPDDMKARSVVEFNRAKSYFADLTDSYQSRIREILRGITSAPIDDENVEILKSIVTEGYEQIINLLNSKSFGGNEDEDDDQ